MEWLEDSAAPPAVRGVSTTDERTAMLALLLRSRGRWSSVTQDALDEDSAIAVLEKSAAPGSLCAAEDDGLPGTSEALALFKTCVARRVRVLSLFDEDYPAQLRDIHQIPPVVFIRGRLIQERRAIAVVGSRKASPCGLKMAHGIASQLAELGVTVVSGLAAGVDTAAHRAALAAGARTVAVLGTGISGYYPPENRELQEEIAASGMLLSQFLPDSPANKRNFPMRNAVMSGYAAATIVVEAGEYSGARIGARNALAHGRPLIFPRELLTNQWARDYALRPGVHVVSNMDELVATVEEQVRPPHATVDAIARDAPIAW